MGTFLNFFRWKKNVGEFSSLLGEKKCGVEKLPKKNKISVIGWLEKDIFVSHIHILNTYYFLIKICIAFLNRPHNLTWSSTWMIKSNYVTFWENLNFIFKNNNKSYLCLYILPNSRKPIGQFLQNILLIFTGWFLIQMPIINRFVTLHNSTKWSA